MLAFGSVLGKRHISKYTQIYIYGVLYSVGPLQLTLHIVSSTSVQVQRWTTAKCQCRFEFPWKFKIRIYGGTCGWFLPGPGDILRKVITKFSTSYREPKRIKTGSIAHCNTTCPTVPYLDADHVRPGLYGSLSYPLIVVHRKDGRSLKVSRVAHANLPCLFGFVPVAGPTIHTQR